MIGKLARFATVGVAVNILYALLLMLSRRGNLEWWLSATIAYLGSLALSYTLQRSFTFQSKSRVATTIKPYLATQALLLVINGALIHLFAGTLGWHPLAAQSLTIFATLTLSFTLFDRWVFAEPPLPTPSPAERGS